MASFRSLALLAHESITSVVVTKKMKNKKKINGYKAFMLSAGVVRVTVVFVIVIGGWVVTGGKVPVGLGPIVVDGG